MNKILYVGDCHVDDEQDLSRFDMLGAFALSERPTHIILGGDFLTLNCLSAWDKDKRKKMEGRRYESELNAGNEALDRLMYAINKYNDKRAKSRKKQYKPELIYIEGNHEERLTRYFEKDPTFEGRVSIQKDLLLDSRGFKWIPYREYYYINGIGFTHIPFNKSAPISGVDITRKAQMVNVSSVVFGHTHEQHLSHVHKEGMPHLQDTYNGGCFFDKKEDYIHGRVTNYWRGVTIITNWKEGRFDIDTRSFGRMERDFYG